MIIKQSDFKKMLEEYGFILLGKARSMSILNKVHETVLQEVPNITEEMMDELMYYDHTEMGIIYFTGGKQGLELEASSIYEIKKRGRRLYIVTRTAKAREIIYHFYIIKKPQNKEEM